MRSDRSRPVAPFTPGEFFTVPTWAIEVSGITAHAKLVLIDLVRFDWSDVKGRRKGQVFPSQAKMADRLGLSRNTLTAKFAELAAAGLIERHERPGRAFEVEIRYGTIPSTLPTIGIHPPNDCEGTLPTIGTEAEAVTNTKEKDEPHPTDSFDSAPPLRTSAADDGQKPSIQEEVDPPNHCEGSELLTAPIGAGREWAIEHIGDVAMIDESDEDAASALAAKLIGEYGLDRVVAAVDLGRVRRFRNEIRGTGEAYLRNILARGWTANPQDRRAAVALRERDEVAACENEAIEAEREAERRSEVAYWRQRTRDEGDLAWEQCPEYISEVLTDEIMIAARIEALAANAEADPASLDALEPLDAKIVRSFIAEGEAALDRLFDDPEAFFESNHLEAA